MTFTARSLFKQMLCNANRSSVDHDSGRYWIILPMAETVGSKSPNPVGNHLHAQVREQKQSILKDTITKRIPASFRCMASLLKYPFISLL